MMFKDISELFIWLHSMSSKNKFHSPYQLHVNSVSSFLVVCAFVSHDLIQLSVHCSQNKVCQNPSIQEYNFI